MIIPIHLFDRKRKINYNDRSRKNQYGFVNIPDYSMLKKGVGV